MRILRFIAIVIGRTGTAVIVLPFAVVFLGFIGLIKAFGIAWSDSQ